MRVLLFCFSMVIGLGACDKPGGPSGAGNVKEIKIVSSLPRTATAKPQTDSIVNGIKMALDEAGWKAGDFTLKFEDYDDSTATSAGKFEGTQVARNADLAIKDTDVMVFLGHYNSGAAKISIPVLNKANLLMISPANSWPGLTKPGKGDPGEPEKYRPTGRVNFTRVVPADDLQGPLGADWAKELGAKKVYILDDQDTYGKGIARLFKKRCDEIGLDVLGQESIDPQQQEYRALMTNIKSKNPDLIYFGGTTQSNGGQLLKDSMAVGLKCKFMVPDGCREESFISSAGPENVNDRTYVTFGGLPPGELKGKGKEFVDNYQKKFGKTPEAYAVYGYEAAKVALEAIRRAGKKDRDAIRQACLSIKDFDGALGKWSFDENGDTTLKTLGGEIIRNGQFAFVKLLGN